VPTRANDDHIIVRFQRLGWREMMLAGVLLAQTVFQESKGHTTSLIFLLISYIVRDVWIDLYRLN
jgi:hypothetical protein